MTREVDEGARIKRLFAYVAETSDDFFIFFEITAYYPLGMLPRLAL